MALFTDFLQLTDTRQAKYISDLVPWQHLVAPGVLRNKDQHALMRAWHVRGRDLVGETPEAQGARMLQANDVLKRLGGKWLMHAEAQRTLVQTYPTTHWRFPVAGLIDQQRRATVLDDPGARETRYYVTLTWQPPTQAVQAMQRLLVANMPQEAGSADEGTLATFVRETDYLMHLLRPVLADCAPCTTDELLSYLHTVVSDRWHPVRWSGHPLDLDSQLCDSPYVGGWYPQLGDWHLRTCSFVGYPAMSHTGMVRQLEALDLDFRWVTRWTGMEKAAQASLLRQTQFAWIQQEKSFFARMGESLSGREARVIDSDATNKARETDAARQEIGADVIAYGEFTSTITVWDTDLLRADAKLHAVRQAFEGQGFVLQPERVHSREAWLSSHPGNRHSSVRKTPQHSLFLAHLLPGLQAAWRGPERDDYLKGEPWYVAHTDTSSLFRVVQHVRDVGHTMLMGTTGSGKSTLVAFLVAQWFARYPQGQCFWFDVDRSARLLTLLLGGHWYDLGTPGLAFQPLRRIDALHGRAIALQWVMDRVEDAGYPLTGEVQAYIESGLRAVAKQPPSRRTLRELMTAMAEQTRELDLRARAGRIGADGQSRPDTRLEQLVATHHNVRMAIKPFTVEGEYGWLFDADHDDLADGPLHTFEQRQLVTLQRLVRPVTSYIFQRLEERFNTETPTWLPMDEAALTAVLPAYQSKYSEWLMTTRKKGVALGFLINALHQISRSPLGLMLHDNCPTRYFLPNPDATSPTISRIYEDFGLTREEIQQIGTARPQRDVYYSNVELGKRLFHLALSPFILDCVARNSDADHALMDTVLQQDGREGFAAAWLRHHGYHDAAAVAAGKEHQWEPVSVS